MHAITVSNYGAADVLQYREVTAPKVGKGQMRVAVSTIGVNYADIWMRSGRYPNPAPLPFVPGWEVVGLVEGRRVAVPLFASGVLTGGYAETVVSDAECLIPVPDGVSDFAAIALLMQGTTAHFLIEHTPVRDRRVVISAAAGGVGTLLVQLARLAGAAQVIALASTADKLALTRTLGADIAIDYSRPDWVEHVNAATEGTGPDLVLDSVGGDVARASIDALATAGTYAVYGAGSMTVATLEAEQVLRMGSRNQTFTSFSLSPALADPPRWRRGLDVLFAQVQSRALRVIAGPSWPLAEAAEAHRALEARATIGKVTLQP